MNELELILTDVLNCSRTDLYSNSKETVLSNKSLHRIEAILKKRAQFEPLQYILGYTEFMGLRIKVKRGALIPRPETEILVESVLEIISNKRAFKKYFLHRLAQMRSSQISADIDDNLRSSVAFNQCLSVLKILDLGTGSGCIAIALSNFLKNIEIYATDISREALNLAKENAQLHNIKNIKFIKLDLFGHKLFATGVKFDIIVSNPPYVASSEIGVFDSTTKKEPVVALNGGSDGLDFYRRIIKQSPAYLKKFGLLIMEMGYNQSEAIKRIADSSQCFEPADIINDYAGIKRIIVLKKRHLT